MATYDMFPPYIAYDMFSLNLFSQTFDNHFYYVYNSANVQNRVGNVGGSSLSTTLETFLLAQVNNPDPTQGFGFAGAETGIFYDRISIVDQNTQQLVYLGADTYPVTTFDDLQQQYSASSSPLNIYVYSSPEAGNQWIAFPSPNLYAQLLMDVLNGGSSDNGYTNSVSACPCHVPNPKISAELLTPGDQDSFCRFGLLQLAMNIINIPVGGVNTYIAPCMNPGNALTFSGGVDPFFYGNVQLKRISNLDRLRFYTCTARPKKCNKTVAFSFIAESCGTDEYITGTTSFGTPVNHPTAISAFMSAQITLFGQPLRPSLSCFDSVFPSELASFDWCPTPDSVDDFCFVVTFPDTQLFLTLEIPVIENDAYGFPVSCVESLSAACFHDIPIISGKPYPRYGCLESRTNWSFDFEKLQVGIDFTFNGAPVIHQSGLIPPEFAEQLAALTMQVMNGKMRETIDGILSDKLEQFLAPVAGTLAQFTHNSASTCFDFKAVENISCSSNVIPFIPPEGCDPCDFCCTCLTAGDCSEKCRANCACVVQFCTAVSRGISPLYVVLFFLGLLIVIAVAAVAMFGIRGVAPAKFEY